jgi:DNA-3-methyladenine glycosylase II
MTRASIAQAAETLARRDPNLRKVHRECGPPPLLRRPATFGTLVHIILEQQVSVESARATHERLRAFAGGKVTPQAVHRAGSDGLRELGFSRQKARYALALADNCLAGRLNVAGLRRRDDEQVRAQIVAQLGLGQWSADVFLMMALLRPDVLPVGDLGLVKGVQEVDEVEYADSEAILERAESWRPYRSVATRMVWQWYVRGRRRDIF